MKAWLVYRGRLIDSYFKVTGVNEYKNLTGVQIHHKKAQGRFTNCGQNSIDTYHLDKWNIVPPDEVRRLSLNRKTRP